MSCSPTRAEASAPTPVAAARRGVPCWTGRSNVINWAFDGPDRYVTARREAGLEASRRTGTFCRVETDTAGLELIPGQL